MLLGFNFVSLKDYGFEMLLAKIHTLGVVEKKQTWYVLTKDYINHE